jgi:hypothetical protein
VNVGYAAEVRALWELNIDEPATPLIEDLDSDIYLEVRAFRGVVVEFAFSKKDGCIRFGIADSGSGQLELLRSYRSPIRRTRALGPLQEGEQRQ